MGSDSEQSRFTARSRFRKVREGDTTMRLINAAATLVVIVLAFGTALGPRGLMRALPEWLGAAER